MLRSDLRTRARDQLYETTEDIWSDAQLNRCWEDEVRSLPTKNIYKEVLSGDTDYQFTQDVMTYTLPTGTVKVEKIERNDGTTAQPYWIELHGWDTYAGNFILSFRPSQADYYRLFYTKKFTVVADDTTALDITDEVVELVVLGMVIRAYRILIGYLRNNTSWDSVTKPGGLEINVIRGYLQEAEDKYKKLVQQYATSPRPRSIDLCS